MATEWISTDRLAARQWDWPSRDEWAIRRRSYYPEEGVYTADPKVADYASAAEIAQAIAELSARWKQSGREMAAAKHTAGALAQQPGETNVAYVQRYLAMSEPEQELAWAPSGLQHERKLLNKIIAGLRAGMLNNTALSIDSMRDLHRAAAMVPTLRTIVERRHVAARQEYDEEVERIANAPIDDAAWEAELQRRREIEYPEIERVDISLNRTKTR